VEQIASQKGAQRFSYRVGSDKGLLGPYKGRGPGWNRSRPKRGRSVFHIGSEAIRLAGPLQGPWSWVEQIASQKGAQRISYRVGSIKGLLRPYHSEYIK